MQKLLSLTRKAISDYKMIEDGDKIAVGLSGGKDSISLLAILAAYKKFAPEKFDLLAINIDLGFADTDQAQVEATRKYCESIGVEFVVEHTRIFDIILERKEKSPCSLCSKMRRGALNSVAIAHGCNKLALGHHADDILETFFLSFIYEGRISTFMPVSHMDRSNITDNSQSLSYGQKHKTRGRKTTRRFFGRKVRLQTAFSHRALPPRKKQSLG